ncbi:MAG: hypothetical protein LBO72_04345 [Helicobacteraceae bacterium]|nr:hypothetical protein [Helicobacteraceae bacterium]
MKRVLFLVAIALAAIGCGRSAFFDFTGSATYAEALPHTKRGEIIDRFESKAQISAGYLNAIYPDNKAYSSSETFLIGLYIANDFKDKRKQGLNNPNYALDLNGLNFVSAEAVDKNSPMLKLMPLVNRWNLYYIVRFPAANATTLNLTLLEKDANKSTTISFPKANR